MTIVEDVTLPPPRNSRCLAVGVDRDEALRLADANRPSVIQSAYGEGWDVYACGQGTTERVVERPMIVAPCGHLLARPTGRTVSHHCDCGRSWRLTAEAGGSTWVAVEVTR